MDRCPYCGFDQGVYRTYTGTQFYHWNGEPAGFNTDVSENQIIFVHCVRCHKKISMRRILREANLDP